MLDGPDFQCLPLIHAIRHESLEAIRNILNKCGPGVQLKDHATNANALFWVAQRQNDKEAVDVAKLLIDEYNVLPTEKDCMNQTCLFYAAREGLTELASFLISKGCDPNNHDNVGQTSLFYAARDGRAECLERLMQLGGDPNLLDNNKQSCLFYAARDGRLEAVRVLLEGGANPNIKDSQRRSALTFAKSAGHTQIVNLFKQIALQTQPAGATVNPSFSNSSCSLPYYNPSYQGPYPSNAVSVAPGTPVTSGSTQAAGLFKTLTSDAPEPVRKKYRLQFRPVSEEKSIWMDAPLIKIEEFERRFPELAVWPRDQPVSEIRVSSDGFKRDWYVASCSLIQGLSKYEGGHIFEKPVDPKKHNCPDYFDVVKNPMSFSCIKGKLKRFEYASPREFLSDVQLVFDNCFKYNKSNSWIFLTGKTMERYFNNQLFVTKFTNYVQRQDMIDAELLNVAKENEKHHQEAATSGLSDDTQNLSTKVSQNENDEDKAMQEPIQLETVPDECKVSETEWKQSTDALNNIEVPSSCDDTVLPQKDEEVPVTTGNEVMGISEGTRNGADRMCEFVQDSCV